MNESSSLPTPGALVGSYKILRQIAQGPFGPLCDLRAEAGAGGLSGLGRLLVVPPDLTPEALQLVSEAAWESMEIRHDQALCVADVVFGTGWVTLVHDHSEGSVLRSLQRRCQESKTAFPVGVALRVALDFLSALEATRTACETSGITWTPGGHSATSLYLCGNGRTRTLDGQIPSTMLRHASLRAKVTSVGFPPPELLDPDRTPDERSDVFAAGTVLWELLTGRELSIGTALARGERQRPNVARLELSIPKGMPAVAPSIVQAVHSALELVPENRIATCAELLKALSADVSAASYAQVIDFTDSLLHRESTLFRLNLDTGPKLSDEKRGEHPKAPKLEWVVELAKQAQSKQAPPGKMTSRAPPKPPSRSSKPPPGPSDTPLSTKAAAPLAGAQSGVANRLDPGKPTVQSARDTAKGDRGLMKRTLLGLSPEFSAPLPAGQASIGKPGEGPRSSTPTAKEPAAAQRPQAKSKPNSALSKTLVGLKPAASHAHTLMGLTAPADRGNDSAGPRTSPVEAPSGAAEPQRQTSASKANPVNAIRPSSAATELRPVNAVSPANALSQSDAAPPARATHSANELDRSGAANPANEFAPSNAANLVNATTLPSLKPTPSTPAVARVSGAGAAAVPTAPTETSTALSLLNAELGQVGTTAATEGPHARDALPKPGGVPLVELPIGDTPKPASSEPAPWLPPQKARTVQFTLTTVILGLTAAVGLTVLTTVLILNKSGASAPAIPPPMASVTAASAVSAPSLASAAAAASPAVGEESAGTAKPEAKSAPEPSAPVEAVANAPSEQEPQPPSAAAATKPAASPPKAKTTIGASPAPTKPNGRKRRTQYVPSGL